ncbi:hypothetical protein GCM10009616_06320 [Microlunatus lacustris]
MSAALTNPGAPATDIDADLESVRKAATGYQTTITTALGLFSISGVVFAEDPVSLLTATGKVLFGIAAALALLAGLAAIGAVTFAAHGWPSREQKIGKSVITVKGRAEALRDAVNGLVLALCFAAASVLLLAAAVAIAWFWWNDPEAVRAAAAAKGG